MIALLIKLIFYKKYEKSKNMYSNFLNILIFFLNFIVKEYYDIVIIPVVIGILIKYLPFIWKLYNLI